MIWLAWKLLTLPIRVVWRTVRVVGVTRIAAFGAGVGVGVLLEPKVGDQVRATVGIAGPSRPPVSPTDLGAAVRDELARSPRTWHLPQPVVKVEGSRVTITGEVAHADARADLGRVAGAVAGVAAVDNQVTVVPSAG